MPENKKYTLIDIIGTARYEAAQKTAVSVTVYGISVKEMSYDDLLACIGICIELQRVLSCRDISFD